MISSPDETSRRLTFERSNEIVLSVISEVGLCGKLKKKYIPSNLSNLLKVRWYSYVRVRPFKDRMVKKSDVLSNIFGGFMFGPYIQYRVRFYVPLVVNFLLYLKL